MFSANGIMSGSFSIEHVSKRNYDVSTALRFVAITLIVFGHLDAFHYGGGGAHLLLVIVGFNIASFKLKKILTTGSVFPVALMILKVVVPTVLYTALLHFLFGPFTWQNILLVGNLFAEPNPNGFGYWFIEVYVQVQLALMMLLAAPSIRRMAKNNIRLACYLFVTASSALMMVCYSLWDTSEWFNRLPWLMLWMVAFGFAARFADMLIDKFVLMIAFSVLAVLYLGSSKWFIVIGYFVLIFSPDIRLPLVIAVGVRYVAAGSLFIYLTHFQVAAAVAKILGPSPWISSVVALIVGASLFHVYNNLINKPMTGYFRRRGYVV